MDGLADKVQEWVAAGLISDHQAKSIVDFETRPRETTRIPLAAEAVGYVGGLLALSAIIMLVGQAWEDLSAVTQLLLIGVPTLIVLGFGGYLRTSDNPSATRLAAFLWALAVIGASFWFGWFSSSVMESSEIAATVHAAGAGVLVALGLYWIARTTWQQIALIAAVVFLVGSSMEYWKQDFQAIGLVLWSIGVVWLLLTWGGIVVPVTTGYVLGSIIALLAPLLLTSGPTWAVLVGLVTAIGLIAAGVALRRVILLGIGGFGLFVHVPVVVFAFFGDELNPPLALLASSIILLVAALVLARLGRRVAAESAAAAARTRSVPVAVRAEPAAEPLPPGDDEPEPGPPGSSAAAESADPAPDQPEPGSHPLSDFWGKS